VRVLFELYIHDDTLRRYLRYRRNDKTVSMHTVELYRGYPPIVFPLYQGGTSASVSLFPVESPPARRVATSRPPTLPPVTSQAPANNGPAQGTGLMVSVALF